MKIKTKTFCITTLGCKVNQYESDAIRRQMEARGWTHAPGGKPADLIIVNTCAVTGRAAMQSRQEIRKAVRNNPGARIMATGCYAEIDPDGIQPIRGVHAIVGHGDKHRVSELANAEHESGGLPMHVRRNIREERIFRQLPMPAFGDRTRPVLKIQDGCNAFCTYCIVPKARGPSRSLPPEDVISHVRKLWDLDYKEIVLSGIHLGNYGMDLTPPADLPGILVRIRDLPSAPRIRLSSIEPNELTGNIIRLVAESDRFSRHFHIPLQSGDNSILERMHRPYTRGKFSDLVHRIRDHVPDAAIGADVLVGFPGETESAFENTYELINGLPVTYLHVFPFSSREGTPAHTFTGKVPGHVIKERCRRIRELGKSKKRTFYSRFIGKTMEALIETSRDKKTGMLKGITSNYIALRMEGGDELKNTLTRVKIDDFPDDNALVGCITG